MTSPWCARTVRVDRAAAGRHPAVLFCWHPLSTPIEAPTKGRGGCSTIDRAAPTARRHPAVLAGHPELAGDVMAGGAVPHAGVLGRKVVVKRPSRQRLSDQRSRAPFNTSANKIKREQA